MWINGKIYKYVRAPRKGLKVHLGPGYRCYLNGWLNVDANITAKIDLFANLSDPLPFHKNSVSVLYTFNVLQHLPYSRVEPIFKEIYACLEPGGYARISVQNWGNAAIAYAETRMDWFGEWPRAYESLGGKFVNFLLCAGEVKHGFDFGLLSELLGRAGFAEITESKPCETARPDIFGEAVVMEHESCPDLPHQIVVEVRKEPDELIFPDISPRMEGHAK